MSYLKLFRKEALRKQYKNQQYGESVIQQPLLLDKALLLMLVAITLLLSLAVLYPFISIERFSLMAHDSNYVPIISPVPVVVERHLVADGSRVNRKQQVTQVRTFDQTSWQQQVDLIPSTESGWYFSALHAGSTAQPFETIAKVLRHNEDHLFFFSLSDTSAEQLKPGQQVQLSAGQNQAQGRVHSVIGPYQQGRITVGIQLEPSYDLSLLHPAAAVRLERTIKRNNFFALLREERK